MQYDTSGEDLYRIQSTGIASKVSYAGVQWLTVRPDGKDWRFEAHVRYTRDGPDGRAGAQARFVQILHPDGTIADGSDDDPDFLTILNQPFAVHLDAATLRDLRALHGKAPFAATSPLGAQAVLHGYLRPAPAGPIDGHSTAAVKFDAAGAMTGPLPGSAQTLVAGTMRMEGTAYYAVDSATLLALQVTLTLDARLTQSGGGTLPVRIFYRRWMRAIAIDPKTPLPTPLATGAGTALHAVP